MTQVMKETIKAIREVIKLLTVWAQTDSNQGIPPSGGSDPADNKGTVILTSPTGMNSK